MDFSSQSLQKPKYPPDLVMQVQDDCADIRKTLKELRDKRTQTDYPVELNRIDADIKRLTQDLSDCEKIANQLDRRSGNLNRILGDWSGNIPRQNPETLVDQEELKELEKFLIQAKEGQWTNLICIDGSVGVGKSTLAFLFAEKHWKDFFPDGAFYQDVSGKTIEEVALQFLRCCNIKLQSDDDPVLFLTDLFQQKRMLFIFDNADNEEIQELFPSGQKCAAIVTTRDKRFCDRLPMKRIHLKPLSLENGLDLLTKEMGETGRQRILTEPEAARKIVKLVGGLPLALSIVGSFLNVDTAFSLSEYANYLEQAKLDLLSQEEKPNRNVRACFNLSINRLSSEEKDLFACLSVCAADGFTADVVIAVAGYPSILTRLKLAQLCRYSLIDISEVRYRLQTLLREFARELGQQRSLLRLAEDRHQKFIEKIREIQELESLLTEGSPHKIIKQLDNIIYAAEWLKEKKIAEYSFGFNFCEDFFDYHSAYNSYAVKLMSIFRELAESRRDWEYDVRCRVQQAKYMDHNKSVGRRQILQLLKPIEQLLKNFESEEKLVVEGRYRNTYADVLASDGKYEDAIKQLRRTILIYQQQNFQQGLAKAHTNLGNILRKKGNYKDAVTEHRLAVALEERMLLEGVTKTESGLATALTDLGITLGYLGQEYWLEAVQVLERSNNLKRSLGHKMGKSLSMGLNSLGDILCKLCQYDLAIAAFEESLQIKQRPDINDISGIAIIRERWFSLLQEMCQQGNRQQAILYCNRAIQILPATHQTKFLKFQTQMKMK
ncbi:tetratricopeptide repeat protein [Nostoc spongiaeforme FACHB-130]|uniref:Tetratricopeptide repeat protein n=1 Tax=Nostoc spongiaeforme FACHB-130 TaxID=1357510 RepID=A0ABR8FUM5_9NOSO|nr:tetratricopeptide repeat protein [Nostoc spongiaeforme]MBD2594665.1 tetratricopeptide repeat protein [Nostoc spongiaeforme FACHB-130]